jgi:peptide/nickel transport system permease protein
MKKSLFKSKFMHDFFHDPFVLVGSFLLIFFILAAVFSSLIAPQNPYDLNKVSLNQCLIPPIWMEGGQSPYLLGTDDRGRDVLSTILYGLRTSLIVGFGVVLIAGTVGIIIGLLGGYYGGWFDAVTMRVADVFFSFSTTLLAFFILGFFKQRGVLTVIIAISLVDWVMYARTMRGSVLQTKEQTYILAAKATGAGDIRLLLRHLLPNTMSPIFVVMAIDLAVVIMLEATLSFLGVGVPLTEPSLGMMIADGKDYAYAGKYWLVLFPSAAIVLLVVGINLFADWLREEMNPKI